MHPIQEKLLAIIEQKKLGGMTLREIGALVGEPLPQKIKHHLQQLQRKGFIVIDAKGKNIIRVGGKNAGGNLLVSIPIVGTANCGPATIFATQNIEGYLKVSKRLAPQKKKLFAIRADGNSLNRAEINGKNVETGDFVIVDGGGKSPKDGDYILSVIDGLANIKKYRLDKRQKRIALLSESTQSYSPIFIHEDDNFQISGKAVDVIKNLE